MGAMMRAAWRWVAPASWVGAVTLGACTRKPVETASPEAEAPAPIASESGAPAEAAAPVAAAAANEADVTRYPEETPLPHALGTTHAFASSVRTQASATGGTAVVALKAETDVDEIAEHQGFVLVYFVDPRDPSRKLMGWLNKVDFVPAAVPTVGHVVPDAGNVPPPPPQRLLDVRQEHGMCPGGYGRCGAMCRLQCGTAADCGGTAHCLHGFCLGTGSAPCAH